MDRLNPPTTIKTDVFTTRPAVYIREIMTRWAGHWWWVIVVPFVASLIAGFSHPAFLFVAFIWLFIIFPPVLLMVYIVYGMRPEVQHVVLPHRVTLGDTALTVDYVAAEDDDNTRSIPPRVILLDSVAMATVSRGNLILTTALSRYDLVIIPLDAIPADSRPAALKRFFSL